MSNACKKLWLALAALMALAAIAQAGASFATGLTDWPDLKAARVRQFALANSGHVELIAPGSAAWSRVTESIDAFFRYP
jgi:hypothetical protein